MSRLPLDRLPLDKLPLDRADLDKLTAKARAGIQVAGALTSAGRALLPGLVRSGPKLIESAIGGAAHLVATTAHRLRSGDAYAPPLGEHQISEVEDDRDAALPRTGGPSAGARRGKATPTATPRQPRSARQEPRRAAVEKAVLRVADHTEAGEVLAHADLPLKDYDHLTLGSLRGRLRSLDVAALVQLRSYERVHANRLPVITSLENRIAKLQADEADSGTPKLARG